MELSFGTINIVTGWITMVVGILTGSCLGMFAFKGPFPCPPGWEQYDSLPRRMVRLAHIAFVMLPIINILYGQYLDQAILTDQFKLIGSYLMIFGMIGVPVLLILGAMVWLPFKYLEFFPVTSIVIGLCIISYGYLPYLN